MKRLLASVTLGLATMSWPTQTEAGTYRLRDANVHETEPVAGLESTKALLANCLVAKATRTVPLGKDSGPEFAVIQSFQRSGKKQFTMPDPAPVTSDASLARRSASENVLKAELHSALCQSDCCEEECRIEAACDVFPRHRSGPLSRMSRFESPHGPNASDCDVSTSAAESDCPFTFGDYDKLASSSEVETSESLPQFDVDGDSIVVLTNVPDQLNFFLSLFDLACAVSGFLHRVWRKTA